MNLYQPKVKHPIWQDICSKSSFSLCDTKDHKKNFYDADSDTDNTNDSNYDGTEDDQTGKVIGDDSKEESECPKKV